MGCLQLVQVSHLISQRVQSAAQLQHNGLQLFACLGLLLDQVLRLHSTQFVGRVLASAQQLRLGVCLATKAETVHVYQTVSMGYLIAQAC